MNRQEWLYGQKEYLKLQNEDFRLPVKGDVYQSRVNPTLFIYILGTEDDFTVGAKSWKYPYEDCHIYLEENKAIPLACSDLDKKVESYYEDDDDQSMLVPVVSLKVLLQDYKLVRPSEEK